jgi:hypothetical protein
MSKKSRLPIPIVNSRYLPTIGRLIGKTDGHLNFFVSRQKTQNMQTQEATFLTLILKSTACY